MKEDGENDGGRKDLARMERLAAAAAAASAAAAAAHYLAVHQSQCWLGMTANGSVGSLAKHTHQCGSNKYICKTVGWGGG